MGVEEGERKLGNTPREVKTRMWKLHSHQDAFLCFVSCPHPQPTVSTPPLPTLPKVSKPLEKNRQAAQDISQLFLSSAVDKTTGCLMTVHRPDDSS